MVYYIRKAILLQLAFAAVAVGLSLVHLRIGSTQDSSVDHETSQKTTSTDHDRQVVGKGSSVHPAVPQLLSSRQIALIMHARSKPRRKALQARNKSRVSKIGKKRSRAADERPHKVAAPQDTNGKSSLAKPDASAGRQLMDRFATFDSWLSSTEKTPGHTQVAFSKRTKIPKANVEIKSLLKDIKAAGFELEEARRQKTSSTARIKDVQSSAPDSGTSIVTQANTSTGMGRDDVEQDWLSKQGSLSSTNKQLPGNSSMKLPGNIDMEEVYKQVAALGGDATLSLFIKNLLANESRYITEEDEGRLAMYVQWLHDRMLKDLSSQNWVKDEFTDDTYQKVVALHDDDAMKIFVHRMLASENKFIASEGEGALAGIVQWYSGTKSTQSLADLKTELGHKPWIKDMRAAFAAPEVTEAQYQELAALHSDFAMGALVKKMLASENKFIPAEEEGELAGFVPWFSGTKAIQNLAQMRQELFSKKWVMDLQSTGGSDTDWTQDNNPTSEAHHVQTRVQRFDEPAQTLELLREPHDSTSAYTEQEYQRVAALRNDEAMEDFVMSMLASQHKFVPSESEDELQGFVQWYSGTEAVQSLAEMQRELGSMPWVKEMSQTSNDANSETHNVEITDGTVLPIELLRESNTADLEFAESEYQRVADLHDDEAMSDFVISMLASENKFLSRDDEGYLLGFVPWYSGTMATQSLAQMRWELSSKPWVKDMQSILIAPKVTEAHYQEIEALHSDLAMGAFAMKLLASENKYIPSGAEGELAGFVQWFSGTKATQSFAQMREELLSKSWVKDVQTTSGGN